MRRLLVTTFLTLDGVMQAPGGPGEDDSGGFTHGGWSMTYWDDLMGKAMGEIMGKPLDLVLGRRTYDIFRAYWPNASEADGAKPLNDATKYVASRGKPVLDWGPVSISRATRPRRSRRSSRATDPSSRSTAAAT